MIETIELGKKICQMLDEKKGMDIAFIDVQEVSGVTDYFVVVTGSSPPHLKALFTDLQHRLKQEKIHCYRRAGDPESEWLVLDYVDVVIHMFSAEARQYYALETLWEGAPRLDWQS